MPKEFLYKYYSQHEFSNSRNIFVDNCEENKCKITNLPRKHLFLNGDEILNFK